MGVAYNGNYTSVSQIKGPSGFYNIDILGNNTKQFVYVNQDYDGGGWICVLANRANTQGMNLNFDPNFEVDTSWPGTGEPQNPL